MSKSLERRPVVQVSSTPQVTALLADGAVVGIGVSGGKDSTAAAWATNEYLNQIGHQGPRILIHSDLGRVEWKDSLPTCQRLADRLGMELVVVQREAGDLLDRWRTRWETNVKRYQELECVKLIMPWSTPSMRFCTSELKTAIIARQLVRMFPGKTILSVSGIRRQESHKRAKAPVVATQQKLYSVTHCTTGYDWHPILEWQLDDVWRCHQENGLPIHEAYQVYGSSRVSCAFCIMSSIGDLHAAASCPDNQHIYRLLVELECDSGFSFHEKRWLGDIAPHLLSVEIRDKLERAKYIAFIRENAENQIPKHLLYTEKGWPTCLPTWVEAELLAEVRLTVANATDISLGYTDASSIITRYQTLLEKNKP